MAGAPATRFVADTEIYQGVILEPVPQARRFVWIGARCGDCRRQAFCGDGVPPGTAP